MPPSKATLFRLHADYAVSAYQFAWSVTKDESMAQDVVQEFFLKVARNASPIDSAKSERAVVFTMVRNLALDAVRRRSSKEKALQRLAGELPEWFEPAETVDREERQRVIAGALAELPEDQRSVVHLHLWQEVSFREIGEQFGLATQTIASRYRYALEKLRAALQTLRMTML